MEHAAKSSEASAHRARQRRAFWAGLALWLIFCIVAVLLRGIRWDENYEYAQVIAGRVAYPAGHPLARYCASAFSIQPYLSAWLLALGAGPAWICGIRNVLFLASAVIPVYLLASLLSRRILWAHAAALLTLQGVLLEFDGSYPLAVWPEVYSNGVVGRGFALIAVYLLVSGRLNTAALLTGLMPCIHIGQMPPLLALAGLYALRELCHRQHRRWGMMALWGAGGIAICAAFALGQHMLSPNAPPETGPYAVAGDSLPIWQGFTQHHDVHRRLPPGNGHLVLAGTLLLLGLAAYREAKDSQGQRQPRPFLGLLLYTAIIAAVVWGITLVQLQQGPSTPFLLIGWMPYRLINHVPFILLAALVALLAPPGADTGKTRLELQTWPLVAVLAFCAVMPWWPHILGDRLFSRYVGTNEAFLFILYGTAIAAMTARPRLTVFIFPLGLWLALGLYHRFGAACCAAGWLAGLALSSFDRRAAATSKEKLGRWGQALVAVSCIVLAVLFLRGQWLNHAWLPRDAFRTAVARHLEEEGRPCTLVVVPPETSLFQAQTGAAVLAESTTPSFMSYVPALAPAIQQMFDDLYGIRFDIPPGQLPRSWEDVWRRHTAGEWQDLAQKYAFTHVAVPPGIATPLPIACEAAGWRLCRVGSD